MKSSLPEPPALRIVAAFVGAPLFAAAVVAALLAYFSRAPGETGGATFLMYWAYGSFFTATLALVLGFPIWFVLRRRIEARRRWAMLTGGLIGSLPYLAILLGPLAILDTSRTMTSLWPIFLLVPALFVIGGLSGWVFWAIYTANGKISAQPH